MPRPALLCVLLLGLGGTFQSATAQRIKLPVGLAELERIAARDSNDAAAHFNVALGYWNRKRFDDADRALREAVRIEPQFAEAYLALSMIPFARRGRLWEEILEDRVPDDWRAPLDESDRHYRRAFLIDPLVNLRMTGAVTRGRPAIYSATEWLSDFYELIFRGFDDFREGKYEDAHDRLHNLKLTFDWDRHPDRAPASILWFHGIAAAHQELYDEAIQDMTLLLDRELEKERRDSLIHVPLETNEFRYVLAYLQQRSGHLAEADRFYHEALEHDLGLYMAHVQLARMYESQRNWPAAIEERRRAVAANPEDGSLLMDLGVTLANAGRMADARASLEEALAANPRDPRVPYYLGVVAADLGDRDSARSAFERFVAMAPSRFDRQIAVARQRLTALR
jgi:Tfp pilus assembly protein PilF